ncbi:MAG: PrsW family glutamic-type intramembrane protease [Chloroflexota bacterium]
MGSKLRSWTILGLGLVLGPILILISEITLLLFSILVGSVYLAKNPVLNHELIAFLRQLLNNNSFEGVQEFVIPHLLNPWILAIILTFVSVIVPLVEEFIKPAGIWLIVKKNMKPVEGFVMGVLSGAGYALFETLAASGNMGTGQSGFLLGRAGTDLLHIFNTGIVGWAMISDWKLKGWFKLATVFILSVIIHGLWNGFALTVGISSFIKEFSEDYNWAHSSGIGGAFGLVILSLLLLSSLWMINLKFQNSGMEKEKIIDV